MVLFRKQVLWVDRFAPKQSATGLAISLIPGSSLEYLLANAVLDLQDTVMQLLRDRLTLESFHGIGMIGSWHDDESNDCGRAVEMLQSVVEPCQRLQVHVYALVAILVAPSSKKVQGVIQIKVVMPK